jgi:molybdenum cofactor cytidylyltransferase
MPATALVLAAGRSRRMGNPKALLRLAGVPLVRHVVEVALAGGCEAAVVVCGAEEDATLADIARLTPLLAGTGARLIVGVPDGHPIDSLRRGLTDVSAGHAILLWPVDHPFADAALVATLLARLEGRADRIVVPTCGGAWGHPVLLGPATRAELVSPLADLGANRVVQRDLARVVVVRAADPRVVATLNTPEQAAALGVER